MSQAREQTLAVRAVDEGVAEIHGGDATVDGDRLHGRLGRHMAANASLLLCRRRPGEQVPDGFVCRRARTIHRLELLAPKEPDLHAGNVTNMIRAS